MNLNNVSYVGIFVDHIDGELYTDIPNQHITLSYRPDSEKFSKLLNYLDTQCEVVVMGYGNDGKNEGLLVDIPSNIPYYGAEQKHITLSVGQDSSPVKTGFLKFENYIPENITSQLPEALYGKIAVFTKDKQVIYQCMRTTLILAKQNNIKSILIPMFGGLAGGVHPQRIAELMRLAYDQLLEVPKSIDWNYAEKIKLK